MFQEVNLLPFVIEAFATNKAIRNDIDRIYKQNKYEYYKLAKSSKWYNHQIICEGDILRQEYGRKILGILMASENDPDIANKVLELVKKGWPTLYNYIHKTNEAISLEKVALAIYKNPKDFMMLSDDAINSIATITLFLATNFDKKLDDDFKNFAANAYSTRLQHYEPTNPLRFSHKTLTPDTLQKVKAIKKRIYESKKPIYDFRDINPIDDNELSPLTISFELLFDTENISAPSLFDEIEFTNTDIEEILGAYYVTHKNQNLSDSSKFLIAGMYVKYLIKAYKKLKDYYFANNKETLFIELESLEKENEKLKQQVENLQKLLSRQKIEIEQLKKAVSEEYKRAENQFRAEIQKLTKENTELKNELEEWYLNKEELIALRELMFSLENQQQVETITENIPYDELNTPSILVVGGHPNWQTQIKNRLPDIRVVDADALNFNPDSLTNIKIIIFNTAYLNHGMYYKMINYARGKQIVIGYIVNQNIDMALRQIWNYYKKLENR